MLNAITATDQLLQLGRSHHQAGRLPEAQSAYRQILAQQPNHPDALHLLGVLSGQLGHLDRAVSLIRQAIALRPTDADFYSNLGKFLTDQEKPDEAIEACRQALRYKPDFAAAHNNLANALKAKGLLKEAIASYRQALALGPTHAAIDIRNNLAKALLDDGQTDAAIAACREALQLKPDSAEAHNHLGIAFRDKGQLDAAIASYRQALTLNPALAEACNNLANALKDTGQLAEAFAGYRQAIALKPSEPAIHSNLLHTMCYLPGIDEQAHFHEALAWAKRHADPLAKFFQPHPNDRNPHRRLRIGYVSADFREHASLFFIEPLLRSHSHSQFEIFCYSNATRTDAATQRLQAFADQWRSTLGLSDAAMADLIRHDRIDILVDLKLHTDYNRLLVFARKPAPVQASWLGYPGTSGMSTIDYRLTDPHLDPPGLFDACYTEKSLRLPDTFWCYDPLLSQAQGLQSLGSAGPLPALANGHITFGCLNNFCKINPAVLALWARLLHAVHRSRLLLLAPEGNHRQKLLASLEAKGVCPDRIEFLPFHRRPEYLESYRRIDISLDTFPCNGHTTSLDSFWMGVPLVTLAGQTVVGRAGLSQLMNLGLPELVAHTPDEYLAIAVNLAHDTPRLADLRRTLRDRMTQSPLMDAPRFARNLETAYRQIWQKWCARTSTLPSQ